MKSVKKTPSSLIQFQSYLFIISQLKVSFQFLIFKQEFLHGIYLHTIIFYPVSHFETANGIPTTFTNLNFN